MTTERDRYADLPYPPGWAGLLGPLRRGFRRANHWVTAPMLRSGLGPLLGNPLTGSILVLRTTGHRSGLIREAPLGYAVVDGRVVVCAGYGRGTHWFRNALADPQVELVLPGAVLAGRAEEVADPQQRRRMYRALISSMGLIGRATLGDLESAPDARVDELARELPMLAVTPTAMRSGPYDPGGGFWRIPTATGGLLAAGWVWSRRRRRRTAAREGWGHARRRSAVRGR
jgi:deazaflavin-dependent oxidoreductase (nitroreductase family)